MHRLAAAQLPASILGMVLTSAAGQTSLPLQRYKLAVIPWQNGDFTKCLALFQTEGDKATAKSGT